MNPGPVNSVSSGHGVALLGCVGAPYNATGVDRVVAGEPGPLEMGARQRRRCGVMYFSLILT
jgi:hypothetical protein